MRLKLLLIFLSIFLTFSCTEPHRISKKFQLNSDGRVAIVSKNKKDQKLAEFVEDKLLQIAPDTKIVSRGDQSKISKEKSLQYSGDFSEKDMVTLGKQKGATYLIIVEETVSDESFFSAKSRYGVKLKVIDIETGVVKGFSEVDGKTEDFYTFKNCNFRCLKDVVIDSAVKDLLGIKNSKKK